MRLLLLTSAVFLMSAEAHAQTADRSEPMATTGTATTGSEVIVVTARLRVENSRDVPFALNVLDAETLETLRIDDTHSLFRQTPGLSLTSFDDGRFAYFQLRGIGPLSQAISPDDGSVVTYVDGVPQPVYASEFAYLDLERIEVLRGPQGTLFGRNSQGGAINVTTRAPSDEFTSWARAEGGEDEYGLVQGAISGPLVADRVGASLTAHASSFDGFIDNVAPGGGSLGDRDSLAARAQVVFTPSGEGGARFALTANADRQISDPFYYVLRNQPQSIVELDPENRVERTAWGLSLRGDIPLAFADLTLISAFNGFENDQYTDDTDGLIYGPMFGVPSTDFLLPLDFSDWREEERRFYQEVRLSSRSGEPIAWTAGGAYFNSDFEVELDNRSTFSPFLNGDRDQMQTINSYAVFGEVSAPLGEQLTGSLGLRYTRDEKELEATYAGVGFPGTVPSFAENSEATFGLWTGRASLSYAVNDDVNLYATVGRGAKSGGFPRFTLSAAIGAASQPYQESTSWTYEAGLKARLWDGRGRFELAGFYNDVTDEQLFVLDFLSFQFLPVNLDTSTYGIEMQGDVELTPGLRLSGALAWTQGEIQEASAISGASPGNRIPNVAEWSGAVSLDYEGQRIGWGGFVPVGALSYQYVGERAADVGNSFDLPGYSNVDARVGARYGETEFYLFARNLLDEEQVINGVLYAPGVEGVSLARGRVAGVGIRAAF